MTLKSQRNEKVVHERDPEIWKETAKKCDKSVGRGPSQPLTSGKSHVAKEGDGFTTSHLDEKIIGVEVGLVALNRRLIVVENNFGSLESIALEGLDEVKGNLIEQGEESKEELTNLELKLTEALSSLHKEFEALKAHLSIPPQPSMAP